jgi:hypothetical protein
VLPLCVTAKRMDDETTHKLFREASVRFIRAAKPAIGDDKAAELVRHIGAFLGDDWSKALTFSVLSGEYEIGRVLQISKSTDYFTAGNWSYKISAIKAIRSITGEGLGASKIAAERAIEGETQQIKIHEAAKKYWVDGGLDAALADLRKSGLFVEIL